MFKRDKQLGLVLEGFFNKVDYLMKVDFEEMVNQIFFSVFFSFFRSVVLSFFCFRLEKGEEIIFFKLEGEFDSNWFFDVGFSILIVYNFGGKVYFKRECSFNVWSGFVFFNGKVFV